jgi:putative ABC transport system substrate-binding protein
MRRREFIAGLGGAAAWPLTARAQQPIPVIGFLHPIAPEGLEGLVAAFHRGLSDQGYVEGRNVAVEHRWANGQYDRLPELARDLVSRKVAVLFAAGGTPTALAASAATTTIPIVFSAGTDPVSVGLVTSLARPSRNATGVAVLTNQLTEKRIEALHAAVPTATTIAVLTNPASEFIATAETEQARRVMKVLGLELLLLYASTPDDLDAAFATLTRRGAGALMVGGDSFFLAQRDRLAALAIRYGVPAIYAYREAARAGGLMSYNVDIADSYRLGGTYVGRILNGEKPGDLPVQQATKVELIINLKTAKALGLTIPPNLLALANEVIE